MIELITLVNRAVEVVAKRRRDTQPARAARLPAASAREDVPLHLTYFYNMPHIFGRVVDAGGRQARHLRRGDPLDQ